MVSPLPAQAKALYPWQGNTLQVDGGALHYLDEGPKDAPVMLAVHGNPTWSFYWRALVSRFSGEFRVVVPDHIGCGMSDKPQDWDYRLEQHISNLEKLVTHLDLQRVTLVVHDWGGAIGMGVAGRLSDRFERLVVTNTAAFRSEQIPPSIASCRIPGFGTLAVRGFNGFAWAASWRTTVRPLAPAVKQGLLAPYDSWQNRIATLRFVEDIPLKPQHPSYDTLLGVEDGLAKLVDLPMLICWGEQDWCFTPEFRKEWQRRFPQAEVEAWEDASHYLIEDVPERLLSRMEQFIASAP
ncbi:MAG: pimeloyl-ACP methyl ester carboxylesterase [Cognaticolwellia sp.]